MLSSRRCFILIQRNRFQRRFILSQLAWSIHEPYGFTGYGGTMNIWIDCSNGLTSAKFLDAIARAIPDTRSWDEVKHFMGSTTALRQAHAVFEVLAQAEAHAHGVALEDVHFHEVGRLENLSRVIGIFAALDMLGVTEWYASPPVVGSGTVICSHGEIPVPAPATAFILKKHGIPTSLIPSGFAGGELTTPTGAALLTQASGFLATPPDNALVIRTKIPLS
jgi:uncharacterized protein (DUF111 family)